MRELPLASKVAAVVKHLSADYEDAEGWVGDFYFILGRNVMNFLKLSTEFNRGSAPPTKKKSSPFGFGFFYIYNVPAINRLTAI